VRWNAAFGFVDPVRGRPGFSIIDQAEVEAVLLDGSRAVGVRGRRCGEPFEVGADAVVLAAGAYGSPMILMRSGIGDPALLGPAGIPLAHALPGVGRNLQDHPCAVLGYWAAMELVERMMGHEQAQLAFDEGVIVKAQSQPGGPVDLHVFSCGGRMAESGWYWELWVGLLTPDSRGLIRPLRDGAGLRFAIEHRHFSDPGGRDLDRILAGIGHARRIAAAEPLRRSLETETAPGHSVTGGALADWVRASHVHYFHPAGSCAMGRDPAAGAVTDQYGRVHGIAGLMVADASLMPRVTAANTNIPTAMIGHRLARHFTETIT
jgi:choline dehydrogenase